MSWTVRTGASTDERYATERFVATLRMLQADSSTYPDFPLGSSARTYGMTGAGGSMGFADPDLQLGYGYAPNRMGFGNPTDPREVELRAALYEAIGGPPQFRPGSEDA